MITTTSCADESSSSSFNQALEPGAVTITRSPQPCLHSLAPPSCLVTYLVERLATGKQATALPRT
eukprot:scaffold299565_cov15-Tisochrysis_lutea.AAC.1